MTTPFDLDDIFDAIIEEKSVVVLGPNFYAHSAGGTVRQQMLKFLEEKNTAYQYYYEEDGFFLFSEDFHRTLACQKIKKFYQDVAPNDLMKKLVQIPFHIYLTVTPDTLIQQAFATHDFQVPQTAHYKKNTEPQTIKDPTRHNPLVYNAFGILTEEESIILTHDDLYDYFKSIFALKSMPDKVRKALNKVQNIIFLGVPFQKWYMHLLLREFGAHENKKIVRFAADQSVSDDIRTFCYDQFRINFIDHNLTEFVDGLYEKFAEKEKLRIRETVEENKKIGLMKHLIKEGKFEDAIEELVVFAEETDFETDAFQISGRYQKFKRNDIKGILSHEQKQLESNRITDDALKIINQL